MPRAPDLPPPAEPAPAAGLDATALRAAGDAARDAGDWAGAAAAYARYLARHPDDVAIWVQHGHCVKEAGDPAAALASYRRAEAGLPEDPDLPLQVGHALKLAGDTAGARAAYGRALDLAPGSAAPWREYAPLARDAAAFAAPGGLPVLFDVSDLLAWFERARLPSGIQRVQAEVAAPAFAMAGAAGLPALAPRLVAFRPEAGAWRELPPALFRRLVALSRHGADPLDPVWAEVAGAVRDALEAAPDLVPPEGAWLVNPGSSWSLPGYHAAVAAARAAHGLRYAALLHDVGPVLLPEHVAPEDAARFAAWFAELQAEADLLLAVSAATARAAEELRAAHLAALPRPPIRLLRPDARPTPPPRRAPHPAMAALEGRPYALLVGTIESRKDHLFVLHAWLALLRRHGDALPALVLAGRAGFGAEPVLALLRRAPALEGRVLWLDDAADTQAAALREGALFGICHSAHEGWGLPVTEMLAAGKAVVATGHSGLLEAGQGLALHFAPGAEPDFMALVERLSFDPAFRAAQEARIRAGLRLRDWAEVTAELAGHLAAVPPRAAPAPAPAGTVLPLGLSTAEAPTPVAAWAARLRKGAGWHAPEDWGCWTRPGRARLRLDLPEGAGALRLRVALRGAPAPQAISLRLGRAAPVALTVPAGAHPVAVLDLPGGVMTGAAAAELTIEAPGGVPLPDGREVGIGVVAVMACAEADVAARLGFLEALAFTRLG